MTKRQSILRNRFKGAFGGDPPGMSDAQIREILRANARGDDKEIDDAPPAAKTPPDKDEASAGTSGQ